MESISISKLELLLDVHVSQHSGSSLPVDTHAAPLSLAPISACRLLFRPSVVAHGLLAHFIAEALLSAPQMLGSLELLLNPTGASSCSKCGLILTIDETMPESRAELIYIVDVAGLVRSAVQGFQDLVSFPLAAIEARSPAQFITGLGFGSASLVRNLSGLSDHFCRFGNEM